MSQGTICFLAVLAAIVVLVLAGYGEAVGAVLAVIGVGFLTLFMLAVS